MATVPAVPTVATYNIQITLKDGKDAVPDLLPLMTVGETVRYFSPSGEVKIVFPGRSPFRTDDQTMTEVHGEVIMTLVSDSTSSPNGTFVCRCFITPPNGEPVGWQNDSSISGGEHHVKRP